MRPHSTRTGGAILAGLVRARVCESLRGFLVRRVDLTNRSERGHARLARLVQ